MAMDQVYTSTTAPNPKSSWLLVPSEVLDKVRFAIKILEVLLSCFAFILEEVVNSCISCGSLYFFEFVSCTAFLFTLLLVILLSTTLHTRVGVTCWPCLDFVYTCGVAVLFFIASITFASSNSGTTYEKTAMVFGFLATFMFFADAGWFLKTRGFPFKNAGTPQASNGVPASADAAPTETVKLNLPTNE